MYFSGSTYSETTINQITLTNGLQWIRALLFFIDTFSVVLVAVKYQNFSVTCIRGFDF